MIVNILGTDYEVLYKDYNEDVEFMKEGNAGYNCAWNQTINIGNLDTYPYFQNDPKICRDNLTKTTIRHEVIHAFLSEAGLRDSANLSPGSWAQNEEMVDWFAIQLPKINKVSEEIIDFIFK